MCSIYGMIYFKNISPDILREKMNLMSKMSLHRGPDAQEILVLNNFAIGINRLAIVGTKEVANVNKSASGKKFSVMNGEIVNFNNLKNQYEYLNQCNCDSQAILPLYERLGTEFINIIQGMFAIGIYDAELHTLELWRDPMGVKPLYFLRTSEYIIFASEIKMIYVVADNPPTLNLSAIDHILKYRFQSGRQTVFNEINRVLPGEYICFGKNTIIQRKYWELQDNSKENEYEYSIEEFRDIFQQVISEYLEADVKGGFFTSGGLDSSLITALSLKEIEQSKYTQPISVKFTPNSVIDEKYGEILEKYIGKKFEWVEISDDLARHTLQKIIKYYDEPLENPTHIGTYLMAKRAHDIGLKSVLTGDGSDELFLGYERHTCWFESDNPQNDYPKLCWTMRPSDSNILYNDKMKSLVSPMINGRNQCIAPINNIGQALMFEREERLVEYHNMRLDKMTMANGVEAKVPFLDRRIVEYTLKIPVDKLHGSKGKEWLKLVASKWLPDSIVYRPKILFPSLPKQWLYGKGANWAAELLLDPSSIIQEIINPNVLFNYIFAEKDGLNPYGRLVWAIVTLELWLNNIKEWDLVRKKYGK